MFTGPVGPVEVIFYWPEAIFGNFHCPWASGSLLSSRPAKVKKDKWKVLTAMSAAGISCWQNWHVNFLLLHCVFSCSCRFFRSTLSEHCGQVTRSNSHCASCTWKKHFQNANFDSKSPTRHFICNMVWQKAVQGLELIFFSRPSHLLKPLCTWKEHFQNANFESKSLISHFICDMVPQKNCSGLGINFIQGSLIVSSKAALRCCL